MIPAVTASQHHGSRPANHHGLSLATVARPSTAQEPLPVWLAVLMAASCQARTTQGRHDVRWTSVSGRAIYTNFGRDAEWIEPLGVHLSGGETLAVYWIPGETAYTFEVYSQTEKCA